VRKLVVTEFMTLDGSIGAPMWSAPYWGDDIAAFKGGETLNSDTLLLGRVTYEGFAQAWAPQGDDEASGAKYFNNVEKFVVTKTLSNLEWKNSHVLQGGLEEGVRALKARDGSNITVHGSGTLAKSLIKAGLVDELRLIVYPLMVGEGPTLFEPGMDAKLKLVSSTPFASGAVGLVYEKAE
jgi:dihydrofolate reductase